MKFRRNIIIASVAVSLLVASSNQIFLNGNMGRRLQDSTTTTTTTTTTDPTATTTDPTATTTDPPTTPVDKSTTADNSTVTPPPVIPEQNFPEYPTCFQCVYLDNQFDDRGCFRNNATRFVDAS